MNQVCFLNLGFFDFSKGMSIEPAEIRAIITYDDKITYCIFLFLQIIALQAHL